VFLDTCRKFLNKADMGTTNTVVISHLADLTAVSGLLARLTQQHQDFSPSGPFPWTFANFTSPTLLDPARLGGIEMRRAWISGTLLAKLDHVQRHLAPLSRNLLATPSPLVCEIAIGFEEQASKQSKRAYDTIRWKFASGRHHFGYGANGSRISDDHAYRRTAFIELIKRLHLPLVITDVPDGFVLGHANGGVLAIHAASGFNDENPSSFSCEIPPLTPEGVAALLLTALQNSSSGKLITFQWSVRTSPPYAGCNLDDATESPRVFLFLANAGLPANSYDIQLEPRPSTLNELEVLRSLMGPKDSLLLPVGAFQFAPQAFANVAVRASIKEFFIEITSRLPLPSGITDNFT